MHLIFCLLLAAIPFAGLQWVDIDGDGVEHALMQNGVQVGAYNSAKDVYRPFDPVSRTWQPACKPPLDPPIRNYGVYLSKDKKETRYLSNGVAVSKDAAVELVEHGNSPAGADSDTRHRLVLIGDENDVRPILEAIGAIKDSDSAFSRYLIQDFKPSDWQVAGAGYDCSASPTIYLVAAGGKVLWRQSGFDGDVQALESDLRQADPDYNPEADPGPNALMGTSNVGEIALGVSVLACIFLLAVFAIWRFAWRESPQRS